MDNDNILRGYVSKEKSLKVDDYPYGYTLRTSIFYWIESKKGRGDRFCSYTVNPKNGRPNKPKCSVYSTFKYMYLDEKGYVQHGIITAYSIEKFEARFDFILSRIGIDFVSDVQQANIRNEYVVQNSISMGYQAAKYTGDEKEAYLEWAKQKLRHIKTCPFEKLVSFPEFSKESTPVIE
jgi:hypothetical protein